MKRAALTRTLAWVVAAECVLSIGLSTYFVLHGPVYPAPAPHVASFVLPKPAIVQARAVYASPVRLKIPKIGVDAALDYVGLTPNGGLDSPKGPANAAWFDRGPRPGEPGNAVIDGHFGWVHKTPAVFDNLHNLQPGDAIYVQDDRGGSTKFIVRELRTLAEGDDTTAVFRSSDGLAHLNLITCQGTWNETQKSYAKRLVVFADAAP